MTQTVYSLGELARILEAELVGDGDCPITGLATLGKAESGTISFLAQAAYADQLADSQASAVIVNDKYRDQLPGNGLIMANPYLGFATLSRLFDNKPQAPAGIHPTALVDDTVELGANVSVGPKAVVAAHAVLGDNVVIGAGSFVGEHSMLGADCEIAANVTINHGVVIGKRVLIHSATVIGADGFGFANNQGRWEKIAQLGGVQIGDDVEIGACTSIDRGALEDTIIADGVKIDNQVMIAHNVQIGEHSAIAGCVGISGSAVIGKHCTLAGGVGLVGHITLTDNVHVTGMTMVTKSIDQAGSYSSGTAMMPTGLWKKNSVRMRQMDDIVKRLRTAEKQLEQLSQDQG